MPRSAPTQKRVRIASPPVPVSPETPASYSSSPEVSRYSNLPGSPLPTDSENIPYAQALASNPFQSSLSDGESEELDEQLRENTRINSTLGSKESIEGGNASSDPVRATLARFAAVPRRPLGTPASGTGDQSLLSSSKSSRSTLDVDAFKRLLLTGESRVPPEQAKSAPAHALPHPAVISDSSSSNADTASVSQHSLFESFAPILTDTPRTSHELDREEVGSERGGAQHTKTTFDRKPPVPRARHGIPLSDKSPIPASPASPHPTRASQSTVTPISEHVPLASPSDLNKPLPPPPIDNTFPPGSGTEGYPVSHADATSRKAPAPPLSRRRSQNKSQSYQEPYHAASRLSSALSTSTTDSPGQESGTVTSKVPPPPPSRRKTRTSDIDLQSSEAIVHEENDVNISSTQLQLSPSSSMVSLSQPKPQPPPARNSSAAKRLSRIYTGSSATSIVPPLPPPRRVRGSSRSSCDSQGAVMPQESDTAAELRQPSTDSSRNVFGQSTTNDILADLAALQMEVDALRGKQERETSNAQ